MACPMANDPPFARLNHFAADLGIPRESIIPRIGISRGECQKFCVSDFCEGGFPFRYIENESSAARSPTLLGRAERSSPKAAQRRAAGAGLDGEGADQAIMDVGVMWI